MVDAEHRDCAFALIDSIQDAVAPAAGAVDTGEFVPEFATDATGILDQRPGDEVDDCSADRLGHRLRDRPRRRTGNDELVAVLAHDRGDDRNARTASTPRTTSPAATAASAWTSSLMASWSPSSSRVSSRLPRSSGLINTAAGRPFRVTTMRSCSRSTRSTNSENRSFTFRRESVVMVTIVPRLAGGRPPETLYHPSCTLRT